MLERRTFRLSRSEVREQVVKRMENSGTYDPETGQGIKGLSTDYSSTGEACLAYCGGSFSVPTEDRVFIEWPAGKELIKAEAIARQVLDGRGFVISARWLNSPPELYQAPEMEIVADMHHL